MEGIPKKKTLKQQPISKTTIGSQEQEQPP